MFLALMHGQPLCCIQHSSQLTVALLQDQAQQAALLLHKACTPHLRQMVCPQLAWRLTQSTFSSLALHPRGLLRVQICNRTGFCSGTQVPSRQWWLRSSRQCQAPAPVLNRAPLQQVWQQTFANPQLFCWKTIPLRQETAFRRADIDLWESVIAFCAVARGHSWCASLTVTTECWQLQGYAWLHSVRRAFLHVCVACACRAVISSGRAWGVARQL